MYLASVAAIRQKLGFDDMTDINFAIDTALDAAESQLATRLETEFDQGAFVDTFYVRVPPYCDGPAFETQFKLRRGLITSLVSVKYADTPETLADPTQLTDVTATVQLHPDKGLVKDFTTRYVGKYVQISYQAGFAVDPKNGDSYLISSVPQWLQQAATLNALVGMADSPVLSEASIKLDVKSLGSQYDALTGRHLRYAPIAVLPL
jgi:hypothetical protein